MFRIFSRSQQPEQINAPPVIIGALGGSGTRAITNIVRLGGWWMGTRVSRRTQDSLPMRYFLNRWFETLLDFPEGSPRDLGRARARFDRAVARHRKGVPGPDAPWGWKNPRNMWLIPFYASVFPQLKFVHVVRDGRDMSLSGNLFLLRTHGNHLAGKGWRKDPEAAQRKLWAMGNLRAADAVRHCAPGHYFLLRYEDMCFEPEETIGRLYDFLGAPRELVGRAAQEVQPSPGIGRGRSLGKSGLSDADPAFWTTLNRFGYS
jgi:hypothetical protein